jgi:drug/metabolite transporter (DMT)-like permease
MSRTRTIRTVVAGAVIGAFQAIWAAMLWTDRELDTLILLLGVAILLGAGYYLWDDAMGEGVDAAQELQSAGGEDEGEN